MRLVEGGAGQRGEWKKRAEATEGEGRARGRRSAEGAGAGAAVPSTLQVLSRVPGGSIREDFEKEKKFELDLEG